MTRSSALVRSLVAATALLGACSPKRPDDSGMTTIRGESQRSTGWYGQADPIDCGNEVFQFAGSIRQLPPGMRVVLFGDGPVADVGEDFDASDVTDPARRLPVVRFSGAAIGRDHVFTVTEAGGIVHVVETWSFERQGSTWVGHQRWNGVSPVTLESVLARACKQHMPRQRSRVAGLTCTFNPYGLTTLRLDGDGRNVDVEMRPTERRYTRDRITDALTNAPLSPERLATLATTLRPLRAAMKDDDECRFEADMFLGVLDAPG